MEELHYRFPCQLVKVFRQYSSHDAGLSPSPKVRLIKSAWSCDDELRSSGEALRIQSRVKLPASRDIGGYSLKLSSDVDNAGGGLFNHLRLTATLEPPTGACHINSRLARKPM